MRGHLEHHLVHRPVPRRHQARHPDGLVKEPIRALSTLEFKHARDPDRLPEMVRARGPLRGLGMVDR
jgi:hypothetical protein